MCSVFHQLFWCRSLLESSEEMVSEITEKMRKANNFLYLLVLAPNRDLVIHSPLPVPLLFPFCTKVFFSSLLGAVHSS
jgi:hypothetical protein